MNTPFHNCKRKIDIKKEMELSVPTYLTGLYNHHYHCRCEVCRPDWADMKMGIHHVVYGLPNESIFVPEDAWKGIFNQCFIFDLVMFRRTCKFIHSQITNDILNKKHKEYKALEGRLFTVNLFEFRRDEYRNNDPIKRELVGCNFPFTIRDIITLLFWNFDIFLLIDFKYYTHYADTIVKELLVKRIVAKISEWDKGLGIINKLLPYITLDTRRIAQQQLSIKERDFLHI